MNEQTAQNRAPDRATEPNPWCLMTDGLAWYYNDTVPATPEQLLAMAEQLGKIARFNGANAGAPYSVAQHSLLVADLAPAEYRAHAVMHDFHEALTGDTITPLKWDILNTATTSHELGLLLRAINAPAAKADLRIYSGAHMPMNWDTEAIHAVRDADRQALMAEVVHLFPDSPGRTQLLVELSIAGIKMPRLKHPIRPLPWDKAADALKAEMRCILPVFNGGQMP